jgi:hypothetical protein
MLSQVLFPSVWHPFIPVPIVPHSRAPVPPSPPDLLKPASPQVSPVYTRKANKASALPSFAPVCLMMGVFWHREVLCAPLLGSVSEKIFRGTGLSTLTFDCT